LPISRCPVFIGVSSSDALKNIDAGGIEQAYKLADMWDFAALRESLLDLVPKRFGYAQRIGFACRYRISGSAWLEPAYLWLCQHKVPLSEVEADYLGLRDTLFISRLRECVFRRFCTCNRLPLQAGEVPSEVAIPSSPEAEIYLKGEIKRWVGQF
jgi:hypothetical protein